MSDSNLQQIEDTAQAGSDEHLFSQEQVNSLVGQAKAQTRAKYPDYDKYKAAYAELQTLKEASQTDLEKATARADKAEAALQELMAAQEVASARAQVSKDTGVPLELLTASTQEELEAQAETLQKYIGKKPPYVASDGFAPSSKNSVSTRELFAQTMDSIL